MNFTKRRHAFRRIVPNAVETFDSGITARGRDDVQRADEVYSSPHPPDCFWVGCSDNFAVGETASIPASGIIYHDNIANLVATGINGLSAMQYALDVCRVKKIVVSGHHGCTGLKRQLRIAD